MENPRGDTRCGWAGGYEAEAWRAGALCATFNLLKCMVSSLLSALISLPQKKKKKLCCRYLLQSLLIWLMHVVFQFIIAHIICFGKSSTFVAAAAAAGFSQTACADKT